MAASILHRISGAALTIGGLAILVWWLMAIAGGADGYARFIELVSHWTGKVVLIGLTWAFFQHLLTGIRHLAMDAGQGFELGVNKGAAIVTIAASILLTVALWVYILGVFQ